MPKAILAGQVNQTANLLQKSCSDILLLPLLSRWWSLFAFTNSFQMVVAIIKDLLDCGQARAQ